VAYNFRLEGRLHLSLLDLAPINPPEELKREGEKNGGKNRIKSDTKIRKTEISGEKIKKIFKVFLHET
jgi:hypothetical protein